MPADAFGFEVRAGWADYSRLALRTLLIDQLIALPVSLVMTSAGLPLGKSYVIASVYSQCIGALCTLSTSFFLPHLDRQTTGRGLAGVMALYFTCGLAGAEVARHLCAVLIGAGFDPDPAYISWAIGATMALLVGLVLTTVRRLRARIVSRELEALQARINPHFLFNTLNSIAALIREDPVRAETMTLRLSSLFRYTLTAPRRGLVTLNEEITIVEGYLAIEQERLGRRLEYRIDIDPDVQRWGLPALTLQPLVENAIKHGIAPEVSGGSVTVRGWADAGLVHIAITDTGGGNSRDGGTGEGLDNVRRRLFATFGPRARVTLSTASGATEAHVTFPKMEAET
ncbi:MAG: histidine kinase [Acidobacteria bacterium]|nr:histidine kinase [Acidobacteriota bacterium]